MSDNKRTTLEQALIDSTAETVDMTRALITDLLSRVLKTDNLTDNEKAQVAANQILVILSVINFHLTMMGESNFGLVQAMVYSLQETERLGTTKFAGLAKLTSLLLPLLPVATSKN